MVRRHTQRQMLEKVMTKTPFEPDYSSIKGLTEEQITAIKQANNKAFKAYLSRVLYLATESIRKALVNNNKKIDMTPITLEDMEELEKRNLTTIYPATLNKLIVNRVNKLKVTQAWDVDNDKKIEAVRITTQEGSAYWQMFCKTLKDLLIAGYRVPIQGIGSMRIKPNRVKGMSLHLVNKDGDKAVYTARLFIKRYPEFNKELNDTFGYIYGEEEGD